jgi:hypothetical protein
VQLGFVGGALCSAFLNLADRMSVHVLIAVSSLGEGVTALHLAAQDGRGHEELAGLLR